MLEHVTLVNTAKKQSDLLDSFVNVRQYDMMLTYLEATLFQHLPKFHCPSSLIINILFTLATLSDYNNADLLRKEFSNSSSERPVQIRALAVLETLIGVLKNREMHSTKVIDGKENPLYIQADYLVDTEYQLIQSLGFLDNKKNKGLRSKALKTQSYYLPIPTTTDDLRSKSPEPRHTPEQTSDLSPQKKRLKIELSKAPSKENDSDEEDDWAGDISDKKSAQILKNKRFDIALADGKIFNALQWALRCSCSRSPQKRAVWDMWRPIFMMIFDIFEIELQAYKELKKSNESENISQTLTEKFFKGLGSYDWASKFTETILPAVTDKVLPIFPNEAQVAKSVHLVAQKCPNKGKLLSSDAVPFLKKHVYLAVDWSTLRVGDRMGPTLTGASSDNIYEKISLKLLHEGDFNDMLYWFHFTTDEIADEKKSFFMFQTLSYILVQLTTYDFQEEVDEEFVFVEDARNFELLFENVTYQSRHYDLKIENGLWGREGFQLNYSRINLCLFLFLNMWIYWTKPVLDASTKTKLLESAKKGQDARYKVLTSQPNIDESNIYHLTDWLELQFN